MALAATPNPPGTECQSVEPWFGGERFHPFTHSFQDEIPPDTSCSVSNLSIHLGDSRSFSISVRDMPSYKAKRCSQLFRAASATQIYDFPLALHVVDAIRCVPLAQYPNNLRNTHLRMGLLAEKRISTPPSLRWKREETVMEIRKVIANSPSGGAVSTPVSRNARLQILRRG